MSNVASADQLRNEWLSSLSDLVQTVQRWGEELGWATRRIEIGMEDSEIGKYRAPALLLQHEATRVILQPVARLAPGTQGVADLYLMPAYDDIASLYRVDDDWRMHYVPPGRPATGTDSEAEGRPLTREVLREVLDEMRNHAV